MDHGLVFRAFLYLFDQLQTRTEFHFVLKASFLEIYNEKVTTNKSFYYFRVNIDSLCYVCVLGYKAFNILYWLIKNVVLFFLLLSPPWPFYYIIITNSHVGKAFLENIACKKIMYETFYTKRKILYPICCIAFYIFYFEDAFL